ncbi:Hypothetical protein PBC10988_8780 [Planctomycetales bacterium 10988]|nr:Hypothetical protein PBC10988_8780 [Planctomycetales bacterium 10988]
MRRLFSRRQFLNKLTTFGSSLVSSSFLLSPNQANSQTFESVPFCSVAFNVCEAEGWPRWSQAKKKLQRNQQWFPRFVKAIQSLNPQILSFAEAPSRETCQDIAERLEMNVAYFPSPSDYPGALFSTFPIDNQVSLEKLKERGTQANVEKLFSRHWGWAELQLSEKTSLIVHSVHFNPHSSSVRQQEWNCLKAQIQLQKPSTPILLQGDFNFTPQDPLYQNIQRFGLYDTFAQRGIGEAETFPSIFPQQRIDYHFCSQELLPHLIESRVCHDSPFGWKSGNLGYSLSDHLPIRTIFR